jgi:hypothetical protein
MKRLLKFACRILGADDCFPLWCVIFGGALLLLLALPWVHVEVQAWQASQVTVTVYD